MSKYLKNNKNTPNSEALRKVRRNIYWQAGLAIVTIVLTIVIVFAMTSAWYTNIVQTSGLTFQAEAWGFDGNIVVDEGSIVAAPGDEGVIHLEVENTSDSIAAISVTMSKARIDDWEMRKRLYFYVDTQAIRNGETMSRLYLNNQESYTYTLFSQGKLTLTEQRHNDVQLKWQWVYDVLGYYVLCSYDKDTGKLTELEYLRPVEYDYDEATTTFQKREDGTITMELETVDGETTVEEFLKQLSETDGYEQDIDYDHPIDKRYYPVDVELEWESENYGYGVYVYLYNYAEIELATQYDTALGEAAAKAADPNAEEVVELPTFPVQLNISAQKNDENVIYINTLTALNTAMELDTGATLQLTSDINITEEEPLVIPAGAQIMLDLNGNSIQSSSAQNTIEAKPGSSLTVVNGNIAGPGSGTAVYAVGAEVVMSNVKIEKFKNGIYVTDSDNNNALDSHVRIVNCELHTTSTTVFAAGNGLASVQNTQVVIENSKLYSDAIVISGNGTATGNGRWGTDIQIIGSEIVSNPSKLGAGIYQPQKDSILTISDSTVSGYTGICIKAGTMRVDNSTVIGKGGQNPPAESNSGFADTGDAIYVEANYGREILVEIGGNSTITSNHGYSLQVYKPDAKHVTVRIFSGVFDEPQPAAFIDPGSVATDNVVRVKE